ncbi:MAG: hypothetical protein LBL34_05445 [Clostridiales bacterium]|jgi:hypothetical protein|nr:hypothetical protein [Clostridiales bacterium]
MGTGHATGAGGHNQVGGDKPDNNWGGKGPKPKYPGNDPMKPPDGFTEWHGKEPEGGVFGAWCNPDTGESWHSDLNHAPPKGPHWDYNDGKGNTWSVFPDGRVELEK